MNETDSKAKKQGKLKTSPFPERMRGATMQGQQVIIGRKVGVVKQFLRDVKRPAEPGAYAVKIYGEEKTRLISFERLYSLSIETQVSESEVRKLPVKWAQWEASIEAGEVDKDELIEYEEKVITAISGDIIMAKLIPAKKGGNYYTDEDIEALINEVWQLAGVLGADLEVKEAMDDLVALKAKYIEVVPKKEPAVVPSTEPIA